MSAHADLAERASLSLIAADAALFRDLALGSRFEPIRGVAILALMPFLSAFAYESSRYVRRKDPAVARSLGLQQGMLVTSRMRAKITEDKYRTSAEVLENANDLAKINSGWFMEGHRGILGALKRGLQPEVGVSFVRNEVICTTHVMFANMGLTREDLSDASLSMENIGAHMRDRMVPVGEYTALLLDKLGIGTQASKGEFDFPLPRILERDMKSERLYDPIIRRVAPGRGSVGILLTWILSQVNTARLLVPGIAGQNEVAAFKIRFVSLYQAALSLRRLMEEEREHSFLRPDALESIVNVLDAEPVRNILDCRSLRNDLFHYGVGKRTASHLDPGKPLLGLVEVRTNGNSFAAVARDVGSGLDHVSRGLRDLLPRIPPPRATT